MVLSVSMSLIRMEREWLEVNIFSVFTYHLVSVEDAPEQAFMNYVVTSFIGSTQQLAKLSFGEVEHMITKYQDMTVSLVTISIMFNYPINLSNFLISLYLYASLVLIISTLDLSIYSYSE